MKQWKKVDLLGVKRFSVCFEALTIHILLQNMCGCTVNLAVQWGHPALSE